MPWADIDPGPLMDFLGPSVVEVPWRWRILGFRTFRSAPGASCDTSGDVDVAYTMGTDMWAPETVVVRSGKGVRSGVMCLLGFNCQWNSVRLPVVFGPHLLGINNLFAGDNLGPGRGWNVSTGGVLCLSLFDRFVPMHSAV